MALRAEAAHESGRRGVFATKSWLESTTHIELPFDAYRFSAACTVNCLDNSLQTFDLFGRFLTRDVPLYVEVKTYTTVGGQPDMYRDFLAIAYSATAKEIARTGDWKAEFMWVTTHPFAQTDWPKLTTRQRIQEALDADDTGLLNGAPLDPAILDLMADRVWLLVLSERQHSLTLSHEELKKVESVLGRKG